MTHDKHVHVGFLCIEKFSLFFFKNTAFFPERHSMSVMADEWCGVMYYEGF